MTNEASLGKQAAVEVRIWRYAGTYWEASRHTNLAWPHPYDTSSPPNALSNPASFIAEAQNKCLSKARNMKANMPVFLAEGRKTTKMIADMARKLAKAYKAFKRGNFKGVSRILGVPKPGGSLANNWLEWSYGWLPLVSELKGMAELAAQQLELGGRKPRITVSARCQATGSAYSADTALSPPNPGYNFYLKGKESIEKPKFSGKAWLKLELKRPDAALAAQLGMGSIVDLAMVAWELTPFSFVFDWLVDVGSWLENIGSLEGWTVLDGGYSISQDFRISITSVAWYFQSSTANLYPQGTIGPSLSFTKHTFSRNIWSGSLPSIHAPLTDGLGARRIISALALGRQRLGG